MEKFSITHLFAIVLTSSLLLTGCGGSSSDSDSADNSATAGEQASTDNDNTEVEGTDTDETPDTDEEGETTAEDNSSDDTDETSETNEEEETSTETNAAGLSDKEVKGLLFMREEEELARDLYMDIYYAKGSTLNVFKNISEKAETKHAEAMRVLLETYGVDDPSTGVHNTFNDEELQHLYNDLFNIAIGSDNLAALKVGALVEETDIADINEKKSQVSEEHQDIISTYENLLCGSRNHLRSFAKNIENETGQPYETQVPELDSEVRAILSGEQEKCGK